MFLFISSITFNNINYEIDMRPRVNKGTLVASTDRFKSIKAKRLIIEVIYNFRNGIIRERTIDVRQTINQ